MFESETLFFSFHLPATVRILLLQTLFMQDLPEIFRIIKNPVNLGKFHKTQKADNSYHQPWVGLKNHWEHGEKTNWKKDLACLNTTFTPVIPVIPVVEPFRWG